MTARHTLFQVITGTLLVSLLSVEPALAGPGGFIAKTIGETLWGRLALGVLAIVFLPLIVSVVWKEARAARRVRKDLAFMAARDARFDWLRIQQRAKECFQRVHAGWEEEDLASVSDWMTDWYWQNQQMTQLDRWQREGLINICKVRKIRSVKPLMFAHYNNENDHEDSTLSLLIEARMQDYLADRASGKLVEGSKRFKDVETVWTFTMEDGEWKVADVDEGSLSLAFANQMRHVPPIESTVLAHRDV